MKAADIREKFLSFFESHGHLRHPSASLVPDDPTLLTTSAGMVQFKPYFLGHIKPPHTRLTTSQKCLRAVDIEEVGRTPRHHTFFEMLGNFSFGDYFKDDAIAFAWEFLTKHLNIPAERLKVSIYKDDEEAATIWRAMGIPNERFFRYGEDDNFWPAGAPSKGPNGPCGPCSEIFYDFGPERGCGRPDCHPACDCNRHIEIWNLVFMQYDRGDGGTLTPLPAKNIDTGSGLERVASVLQGTLTNFETDLFMPTIKMLEEITGRAYADTPVPFRVVADHIRGAAFLIGDGVFPSNEGRGYLLRKILRRAAVNGRELGMIEPFLSQALDPLAATLGAAYPDIIEKQGYIANIIKKEEEQFAEAMTQGRSYLIAHLPDLSGTPDANAKHSDGFTAFMAYDTYGLPYEEAEKFVAELGYKGIDRDAFKNAMNEQKERSRRGSKMDGDVFVEDKQKIYRDATGDGAGVFAGYDTLSLDAEIVALISEGKLVDSAPAGFEVDIITDKTPFYGEMGGQIGDTGVITLGDDTKAEVLDTFAVGGAIMVHRARVERGTLKKGDKVRLEVAAQRRLDIMRHHTATHLLHAALRRTLGDHVVQSGSYVGPDKLRFDFTHHSAVDADTLRAIEDTVNLRVFDCIPVEAAVMDFKSAKKTGAMALFGEKYGAEVRVILIDEFSRELCGGTHLTNTGIIGLVKITDERAIGSSLRRIEAVAGARALEYVHAKLGALDRASGLLRVPDEQLPKAIENAIKEKDAAARELKKARGEKARDEAAGVLAGAETKGETTIVIKQLDDLDRDGLLGVYDDVKTRVPSFAVVLGSAHGGKVQFLAAFSKDLTDKGFDAGAVVKQTAQCAGGGGGGKKHLAQAGAKDASKIPEALDLAKKLIFDKIDS